ncbi:hypothetical protein FB45DRAFT_391554 [Roridomyces roridus]|uniref:Zn(2)-C6 fungal-type domain-containing protein n=1 Tax=Roridomyces roridus TaxID=1738132 RepID=A0AAD7B1L0_9AGAR|nr:hypothetical protein FB45DRAFT_391554 [Roridomyces roridus]
MSNNTAKKAKPPACDACKARRVLCHRQPNGLPCPRCVEKGVLCKTTYVPRGRPRKNPLPVNEPQTAPESLDPGAAAADQSSIQVVVRSSLQPPFRELPSELVQHLFECFTFSPHSNFPVLRRTGLTATLSSLSWRIDLLPPEARVLAYCICAQSALISYHPAIIGPGPKPDSLLDHSVLFPGADLRIFGMRRSPACHALHQQALALAKEAGIYLQVSDCNAASCFLLTILDETRHTPTRPWALAYISHIRSLAVDWNWSLNERGAHWAAYLMIESLMAILERKPVIPTYVDQLLLTGPEPPPLSSILESLASMKVATQMVYGAIQPIFFHVSRLSRELYEKVIGEHTHRHPIAENAITDFFSALSTLQSIVSFLFSQANCLSDQDRALFNRTQGRRSDDETIRSIVSAMAVGSTSLTIALYKDLDARCVAAHSTSSADALDSGYQWAAARLTLLRNQAHAMASSALDDVVRFLKLRPYPPDFLTWIVVLPWSEFCLEEADRERGVPPGRVNAFKCILDMLKAVGYSRDNPELHSLVERMEAHLSLSLSFSSDWAVASSSSGTIQSDADLLQQLSAQIFGTPPDPSFGHGDSWIGALDSDLIFT